MCERPIEILAVLAVVCTFYVVIYLAIGKERRDRFRIWIGEIPMPLNTAIKSHHGDTLSEVMEAIRREPLEYIAVCDKNGVVIAEGTMLATDRCNLTPEGYSALKDVDGGCIMVHNHPGYSESPFSPDDVNKFVGTDKIAKTIVVTPHFTYTMEKKVDTESCQVAGVCYMLALLEAPFYSCIPGYVSRNYDIGLLKIIASECSLDFTVERVK